MKQQINLYQAALFEQRIILSARTMALVMVGGALVLLSLYGLARWQSQDLQAKLSAIESRQAAALQRLTEMERLHPPPQKSQLLEKEVQRLQAERDARLPLMALLEGQALGNSEGFSPVLSGLARQVLDGLWLQRISLNRGGLEMALEGRALDAEQVPRYLQQLKGEAALAGLRFSRFHLQRADKFRREVDFRLSTMAEEGR